MARKKELPTETTVTEGDTTAVALSDATSAMQSRGDDFVAVAAHFNYHGTYNQERMMDEYRHYAGEASRAMLEAGARLAMIRSQTAHGDWAGICETLSINQAVAGRMISASLKFSNLPISADLANFGKSKFFELLVLDDDQTEHFGLTGVIDGVGSIDDVAAMTVTELRNALRDARENSAAKDVVLSEKSGQIDKLQTKKALLKAPKPNDEVKAVRRELSDTTVAVEGLIRGTIRDGIAMLNNLAELDDTPHDSFIAGILGQLQAALNETAYMYGVALPTVANSLAAYDADDDADGGPLESEPEVAAPKAKAH